MAYQYYKITKDYYEDFLQVVNNNRWGNLMLPEKYNSSLWGVVVCEGHNVVGGWVGTLRGVGKMVSLLAKCAYFDAWPIFISDEYKNITNELVQQTIQRAKQDGIVMLKMTHWGREGAIGIKNLNKTLSASYVLDLSLTEEDLWKNVESKQRNIVRKGEKTNVEFKALTGKDSLKYLDDFQNIRQSTQSRAIGKNANASMLLKSNDFFKNLFLQKGTTLYLGVVENQVATVALMMLSGDTVYYYSGGSNYDLNKQTGSSAYVIWKSILHCKENGIKYFDMGGVPVFPDVTNPDKTHPAYGVFQFKRSFGGAYMTFDIGEIPVCQWKYKLLNLVLKQRKLLRFLSKKGL